MQIKSVSNIYAEAADKIWTVQNQWKNFSSTSLGLKLIHL